MNRKLSLQFLLTKTKGYYIFLVILVAQIASLPAYIFGSILVNLNSDFTLEKSLVQNSLATWVYIITSIGLLFTAGFVTQKSRWLINRAFGTNSMAPTDPKMTSAGWKEITSFTFKLGGSNSLLIGVLAFVFSGFLYLSQSINSDQFFYMLMGYGATGIISTLMISLLTEQLLTPARELLTPGTFEETIGSKSGVSLSPKLIALVLGMTILMNFILAPIGYHNTVKSINSNSDPESIIRNIRVEAFSVSAISLILGLGFSYIASRTITDPVENLINTFKKIEGGGLDKRAKIMATDELGELAIHFNQMVAQLEILRHSLENQMQEQIIQIKAAYEVGSVASSSLNPKELMDNVTRLITERLGHYYAAIFLLDETQNWAELSAATGDAGKVLKQNKHRLDIKSKNIVAESINHQTMQLLDANNPSHIQLSNPLLPYTKSEISLPLISSNRVIGALNVHATRENAFGALEIETLQAIASHTAITLENARLYQEVQQNLKELSSIQQQYLLNSWSKLTKENNIEYSLGEDDPTAKADSNIPLSLRDQLLGEIYLQTDDKWTPEEQNLVDAIAVQATIAIENARLINESRQMAYLEQLAAEISNKIWTSATIDGVLQVVARDLGRALDADKLVIELALDKKGQND